MASQWYTLFCATSTVWERTVPSCYFCPINGYHIQVKHYHTTHILVSCSNTMTVSRFIEPKILWYSTSILLNTIEAQLLEIQAEGWKNYQRYSHTLPRCTRIAKVSTQLEQNQKSGPSDIIDLPYSGTPKMYSAR